MSNTHKTFRFKCSNEIKECLVRFSKLNQYVDREEFKEKWKIWLENNEEMIQQEKDRLEELNFEGKLEDKLYLSARYYYRNKSMESQEPKKRKKYEPTSRELINSIDEYIKSTLTKDNYQPKLTFMLYCMDENNKSLLKNEICKLKNQDPSLQTKDIENKIKKTYKNRYRLLTT